MKPLKPLADLELKKWEKALIGFGIALFLGSSGIYISGFPIRKYLFGIDVSEGNLKIGKLVQKTGNVRRQLSADPEFIKIRPDTPLYNYDTLVTDGQGGATIALDNGGHLELGPNTMVRLVFDSGFGLDGISRAKVEVIGGQVTAKGLPKKFVLKSEDQELKGADNKEVKLVVARKAAPIAPPAKQDVRVAPSPSPMPSPSPSPTPVPLPSVSPTPQVPLVFKILAPKPGEKMAIDKNSPNYEKQVQVQWSINRPEDRVRAVLVQASDDEEIFESQAVPVNGKGTLKATVKFPGEYEWQFKDQNGIVLNNGKARVRFKVAQEIEGIETLPPLVGGQESDSNEFKGEIIDNFDITLRWKPYRTQKKYFIKLTQSEQANKAMLEKEVEGESYLFNKNKIYTGKVYYTIYTKLPSGFIAVSKPQPFNFNFQPPHLVSPENNVTLNKAALAANNNNLLMTWQKTNFTQGYLFQLSAEPTFKKPLIEKRLKENFFLLRSPPPGKYFWRIKSFSKDVSSDFSPPNEFNVAQD